MLYEILPDPRVYFAARGRFRDRVLQIHRTLPERVPVGHFEENGTEVVDEVVHRHEYLRWIDKACAEMGDRLELRFFDHFEEEFDASVLDELPEVRSLAIDGLDTVLHPEAVGRMPRLKSLLFGPRRSGDAKVLSALGVERLKHFTLAGTPTPAVDLSPLGEAKALRTLRLLGHGKNTEAIGGATTLTELAIQPSPRFSLAFIDRLSSLESLKFVLGRAPSVEAIEDLPVLRDLSFREVHFLEEVGDLQRFPRLRRLQVSDQPRIVELRMGHRNAALEHLYLYSVPGLQRLEGFPKLPGIKSLFAYDSRLELSWPDLPPTLTHLNLMAKTIRNRPAHEAEVRDHGLLPEVHPGAVFFYK